MNNADIERRLENLLRIGTISAVNHQERLVKVSTGKLITQWLAWPADIGNNYIRWRPLRLNTQVIIACISGDPAQASIIGMLYSNDLNSPRVDDHIDVIQFNDGSHIQYDSQVHKLTLKCVGDVLVDTPETTFTGTVTVNGHVTYKDGLTGTGNAKVDGDVIASDVSLIKHPHNGNLGTPTSLPIKTPQG
jgi:phage baseplate assembly protein V